MGKGVCEQITYLAGVVLEFSEVFWSYSYALQNDGCAIALFLEAGFHPMSSMDQPYVIGMPQTSRLKRTNPETVFR